MKQPFPTASDAADVFFSSSETESTESHGESKSKSNAKSNANANGDTDSDDNFGGSPSTFQIEHPTPSHITLPTYSHVDFGYVDNPWLSGSDDMDTNGR